MTDEELNKFLSEHYLEACGPTSTLKDRAARLQKVLGCKGFLWEGLTPPQRKEMLQGLLEVADVFCVSQLMGGGGGYALPI